MRTFETTVDDDFNSSEMKSASTKKDVTAYGKREWDREGIAQSGPWDVWISPKLFLDQLNASK